MLENLQIVLAWIGAATLVILAFLPVLLIFSSPRFDEDNEPHGDTTGYDRSGKDHRP
jgi:hypothetical protein